MFPDQRPDDPDVVAHEARLFTQSPRLQVLRLRNWAEVVGIGAHHWLGLAAGGRLDQIQRHLAQF
jgi:hypothetical protein